MCSITKTKVNIISQYISRFSRLIFLLYISIGILELYLEGKIYQTIANILNKEKVLYPDEKHWIDSTINRIINNKIYIGDYVYNFKILNMTKTYTIFNK